MKHYKVTKGNETAIQTVLSSLIQNVQERTPIIINGGSRLDRFSFLVKVLSMIENRTKKIVSFYGEDLASVLLCDLMKEISTWEKPDPDYLEVSQLFRSECDELDALFVDGAEHVLSDERIHHKVFPSLIAMDHAGKFVVLAADCRPELLKAQEPEHLDWLKKCTVFEVCSAEAVNNSLTRETMAE